MNITLKSDKPYLGTGRESICNQLNEAIGHTFFRTQGDDIKFGSFANTAYQRVLAAVLLIFGDEVYLSYERKLLCPSNPADSSTWDRLAKRLQNYDLKNITVIFS